MPHEHPDQEGLRRFSGILNQMEPLLEQGRLAETELNWS